MLRTALGILVAVAVAYLLLCLGLFVFQRSLLYFPQERARASAAFTLHLVAKGAQLVVSHRPYVGPHAIIYFGGNAEDVSQTLPDFEQAFPGDSITNVAAAAYPFVPVRALSLDRYESVRYAPKVKAPTTLVLAERDEVISRASSDNLAKQFAAGVAHVVVMPGASHNSLQTSTNSFNVLRAALSVAPKF